MRITTISATDSGPLHVACIGIQLDTIESTVYEQEDKLDDQKHVFYKFMH